MLQQGRIIRTSGHGRLERIKDILPDLHARVCSATITESGRRQL